jgi:Uma2 family endonuclease
MTLQERLSPGKYALRVADYAMLGEAGVFGDRRTELIEGDVIVMAPEFRPHAYVRDELAYRLRRGLEEAGSPLYVSIGSVALNDTTMPQPDIVLTSEPRGPGAIPVGTVPLLAEVSSSTLDTDLGRKLKLYAAAGVPEYWVVDVNKGLIHQMWHPGGEAYAERREVAFGQPISAATIPDLTIETTTL